MTEHPSPAELTKRLQRRYSQPREQMEATLVNLCSEAITAYEAAKDREDRLLEAWKDPSLESLHAEGGKLEAVLGEHPVIKLMAANLGKSLGDAVNFIEVQLADEEAEEQYVVTVRRKDGQTPVEQRDEARAERDRLRELLDEIVSRMAPNSHPWTRDSFVGFARPPRVKEWEEGKRLLEEERDD